MSFASEILLLIIKTIICAFDLITLPFYLIIQQPCEARIMSDRVRANKLEPTDPNSPWSNGQFDPSDSHFIQDCKTIPEILYKCGQHFGDRKCMGYRECFGAEDEIQPDGKVLRKFSLGDYIWYSYGEIQERVDHIREGFLAAGIKPGSFVVIISETRLEWLLAAQALFQIKATIVTLYTTLSDEGIIHGINDCETSHVITSSALLAKLRKLQDKISLVKCFILFGSPSELKNDNEPVDRKDECIREIRFQEIELNGTNISRSSNLTSAKNPASLTRRRLPSVEPDDTAIIMYTSGTTGKPKGVMIAHKNLIQAVRAFFNVSRPLESGYQTYMSYLPLAHIYAFVADFFALAHGIPIGYSSPATMSDASTGIKEGQRGDATVLKPTITGCVPLILDRIRTNIIQELESRGPFFIELLNFVVDYKKFWSRKGFSTPVMNFIICRKFNQLLGGKVKVIGCGGAPLSSRTQDFIQAVLNVKVLQGYGLTETLATTTMMDINDLSTDTVGPPLQGVLLKLVDWEEGNYRVTDEPLPRGEIVIGGDSVAAGYFRRPEDTAESFREENGQRCFYTGDIGEMLTNGKLRIIDRKKELVKMQHGEYVSLSRIESELKACKYVDNICIYGDSLRNHLVALVRPNGKFLLKLAHSMGKRGINFEELCKDQAIRLHIIEALIECAKEAGLQHIEIPTKYKLCHEEWLPEAGLVTAAMKIRRRKIQSFYQKDIDDLFLGDIDASGI